MKYTIEFQYAPSKTERPLNEVYMVIEGETDNVKNVFMPDVGDYVRLEHVDFMPEGEYVWGKVRSRLFHYVKLGEKSSEWCNINIVVEATDDNHGMILKQ